MSPDIQFGLFPDTRPQLYATAEFLGRSPSDILTHILEINKDIAGGEYVTYPSLYDSDYGITSDNAIFDLSRDQMWPADIYRLSVRLNRKMRHYRTGEYDDEGREDVITEYPHVVVVGSRVLVDESFMQIPMLDFARLGEEDPTRAQDEAVAALRELGMCGYLLNSGKGFHFWGINLITPEHWRRMMAKCKESEEDRITKGADQIFDQGFLVASIKRDFAALRIFGYPPDKAEPYVVRAVN